MLQEIAQYQDILELDAATTNCLEHLADIEGHRGVDLVADLNKPIALESSSYDVIISIKYWAHTIIEWIDEWVP